MSNFDISPVHQRMGELTFKLKHQGLTDFERKELEHCMDWNMNQCLKAAALYNLSFAAHVVDDTEWQHEICSAIDQLLDNQGGTTC
jgi:hypothetical protein